MAHIFAVQSWILAAWFFSHLTSSDEAGHIRPVTEAPDQMALQNIAHDMNSFRLQIQDHRDQYKFVGTRTSLSYMICLLPDVMLLKVDVKFYDIDLIH